MLSDFWVMEKKKALTVKLKHDSKPLKVIDEGISPQPSHVDIACLFCQVLMLVSEISSSTQLMSL